MQVMRASQWLLNLSIIMAFVAGQLAYGQTDEEVFGAVYSAKGSVTGTAQYYFTKKNPTIIGKCAGGLEESGAWGIAPDSKAGNPTETESRGEQSVRTEAQLKFGGKGKDGSNLAMEASALTWDTSMTDGQFRISFVQKIGERSKQFYSSSVCNATDSGIRLNSLEAKFQTTAFIEVPQDVYVVELKSTPDAQFKEGDFVVCAAIHKYDSTEDRASFKPSHVSALTSLATGLTDTLKDKSEQTNNPAMTEQRLIECQRLAQQKGPNGSSSTVIYAAGVGQGAESKPKYALVSPGDRIFLHVVWKGSEVENKNWTFDVDAFLSGSSQCFREADETKGHEKILGSLDTFDPSPEALSRLLNQPTDGRLLTKRLGCLRHPKVVEKIFQSNYGIDVAKYVNELYNVFQQFNQVGNPELNGDQLKYIQGLTVTDTARRLVFEMTKYCSMATSNPFFKFDSDQNLNVRGYRLAAAQYKLFDTWLKSVSAKDIGSVIELFIKPAEAKGLSYYEMVSAMALDADGKQKPQERFYSELEVLKRIGGSAYNAPIGIAHTMGNEIMRLPDTMLGKIPREQLLLKLAELDRVTARLDGLRTDAGAALEDLALLMGPGAESLDEDTRFAIENTYKDFKVKGANLAEDVARYDALIKEISESIQKDVNWFVPDASGDPRFLADLDEISTKIVDRLTRDLAKNPNQNIPFLNIKELENTLQQVDMCLERVNP